MIILPRDSHHSQKRFAKDNEVEFHPIDVSKEERVKGDYRIQQVSSTHNKIKKCHEKLISS